jgi:hypothetical protein
MAEDADPDRRTRLSDHDFLDDRFGVRAVDHGLSSPRRLSTRRIIRSFCDGSLSARSSASATV